LFTGAMQGWRAVRPCTGAHQIRSGGRRRRARLRRLPVGHDPPDGLLPRTRSGREHGDRTLAARPPRSLTHARVGPGTHGRALERRGRPGAAHKRRWSSAGHALADRMRRPCTRPTPWPTRCRPVDAPARVSQAGPNWLSVPARAWRRSTHRSSARPPTAARRSQAVCRRVARRKRARQPSPPPCAGRESRGTARGHGASRKAKGCPGTPMWRVVEGELPPGPRRR